MAVIQLNTGNFHETVKQSPEPVLVDFYADWCQPCKRIAPIMQEISEEYDGKALVCKVNVDEEQALAMEFNVMSIPFVISFKNGAVHKHTIGAVPKSDLLALLD